jgi:hypothetical protein
MSINEAIAAAELRFGCKHTGYRISPNGTVWHRFGGGSWLTEQALIERYQHS